MMYLCEIISTFFFAGKSPKAPGTFGTIASLPLVLLVQFYLPNKCIFWRNNFITITSIIIFVFFIIGTITSHIYAKHLAIKDPKQIVIDEVVGMMLTVFIVQIYLILTNHINFSINNSVTLLLTSFVLFRVFDIIKPYPISLLDQKISGGVGIMVDDVVAGLFAGIVSILINKFI